MHRGVYLVGPLTAPHAGEMAAVLACGARAALSHWSAAALWSMAPARESSAPAEVSTAQGDPSRRPNIIVHRVRSLREQEVITWEGIRITTPARTLCDLSRTATRRELEVALGEALARGLANRDDIAAQVARMTPARVGRLRAVLEDDTEPTLTRSRAEERFLSLVRAAQLPTPAANVSVRGYRVDFFWRAERLVVEVDGFAHHASVRMFERDRRRDAELTAAGLRVVRVTWRQLVKEPHALIARVAQALARADAG